MDYLNAGDLTKAPFFRRLFAWIVDLIIAFIVFNILYTFIIFPIFDKQWNLTELEKKIGEIQSSYNQAMSELSESMGSEIDSSLVMDLYEDYKQQVEPYSVEYNPKIFALQTGTTLIIGTIFSFIIPLWLKDGQTIGKKILKIGVAKPDGTKISTANMVRRYFIGAFLIETVLVYVLQTFIAQPMVQMYSFVIWLFTALMVPFFPLGRCIHDYIGGTVVVDVSSAEIMTVEEKEAYLKAQDQFTISDNFIEGEVTEK